MKTTLKKIRVVEDAMWAAYRARQAGATEDANRQRCCALFVKGHSNEQPTNFRKK